MQVQLTVLIDKDLKLTLEGVKLREGIPVAAQIRLALLEWLQSRGTDLIKTPSKRAK